MITTLTAEMTAPGPSDVREDRGARRPRRPHDPEDRLHVSPLVLGLMDARACHIDFLDTSGGEELERWLRRKWFRVADTYGLDVMTHEAR